MGKSSDLLKDAHEMRTGEIIKNIIEFAKEFTVHEASAKFKVSTVNICRWLNQFRAKGEEDVNSQNISLSPKKKRDPRPPRKNKAKRKTVPEIEIKEEVDTETEVLEPLPLVPPPAEQKSKRVRSAGTWYPFQLTGEENEKFQREILEKAETEASSASIQEASFAAASGSEEGNRDDDDDAEYIHMRIEPVFAGQEDEFYYPRIYFY